MPDMTKIKHFSEDNVNLIKEGFKIFDHGKQLTNFK